MSPAPRSRPPSLARRGFTLIELLTVIAIIGILAAILIPTVGQVRRKAREATKTSNYRQIWIANTVYANDNQGRTCPSNDAEGRNWRELLAPYISEANRAQQTDYNRIALYVDPLFEEYDPNANSGTRSGVGMNDNLGLPEMNKRNKDDASANNRFAYQLSAVTHPERRMFIGDTSGPAFLTTVGGNVDSFTPGVSATSGTPRHNGKNMIVRFNGLVVLVAPAEAVQALKDPSVPYVAN